MKFCTKCGAKMEEGVKFCPGCGAALEGAPEQPKAEEPKVETPNAEAKPAANDAEENKVMAILAYILFFIPLLTGDHKKSPFVKFHTNQGTVLFIANIIFAIAYSIITGIITSLFLFSGAWAFFSIIVSVMGLLWLVPTALAILGIVNAVKGETKELPVIGKFTIIK